MKEKKHTGFEEYLTTGTFTPQFIHDYEYWCKRIYFQWKRLATDFDTFYSTCWEALLNKIDEFDPNIATIQTFCMSRINNEAWRFYMKYKTRKIEVDTEDDVIKNTLCCDEESIKPNLFEFEQYCNKMGVQVNIDNLYNDYIEQKSTPPMIVYSWWQKMKNKLGEGQNGVSERWG